MRNLFLAIIILSSITVKAQDPFAELETKQNFRPVMNIGFLPGKATTVFPKYVEGKAGLDKFIKTEIVYPDAAKQEGLSGLVVISYSINAKGGVVNSNDGVKHKDLFDELITVVEKSGPWIPGKIEDKYGKIKMTVSYDFVL